MVTGPDSRICPNPETPAPLLPSIAATTDLQAQMGQQWESAEPVHGRCDREDWGAEDLRMTDCPDEFHTGERRLAKWGRGSGCRCAKTAARVHCGSHGASANHARFDGPTNPLVLVEENPHCLARKMPNKCVGSVGKVHHQAGPHWTNARGSEEIRGKTWARLRDSVADAGEVAAKQKVRIYVGVVRGRYPVIGCAASVPENAANVAADGAGADFALPDRRCGNRWCLVPRKADRCRECASADDRRPWGRAGCGWELAGRQ